MSVKVKLEEVKKAKANKISCLFCRKSTPFSGYPANDYVEHLFKKHSILYDADIVVDITVDRQKPEFAHKIRYNLVENRKRKFSETESSGEDEDEQEPVKKQQQLPEKAEAVEAENKTITVPWYCGCEYACKRCPPSTSGVFYFPEDLEKHLTTNHGQSLKDYLIDQGGSLETKTVFFKCGLCDVENVAKNFLSISLHLQNAHSGLSLEDYAAKFDKEALYDFKEKPEVVEDKPNVFLYVKQEVIEEAKEEKMDENQNVDAYNGDGQFDSHIPMDGRIQDLKTATSSKDEEMKEFFNKCEYKCLPCGDLGLVLHSKEAFEIHFKSAHDHLRIEDYKRLYNHDVISKKEVIQCQLCDSKFLRDMAFFGDHLQSKHKVDLEKYYDSYKDKHDGPVDDNDEEGEADAVEPPQMVINVKIEQPEIAEPTAESTRVEDDEVEQSSKFEEEQKENEVEQNTEEPNENDAQLEQSSTINNSSHVTQPDPSEWLYRTWFQNGEIVCKVLAMCPSKRFKNVPKFVAHVENVHKMAFKKYKQLFKHKHVPEKQHTCIICLETLDFDEQSVLKHLIGSHQSSDCFAYFKAFIMNTFDGELVVPPEVLETPLEDYSLIKTANQSEENSNDLEDGEVLPDEVTKNKDHEKTPQIEENEAKPLTQESKVVTTPGSKPGRKSQSKFVDMCEFKCQLESCDFLTVRRPAFYKHLLKAHDKTPQEYLSDSKIKKIMTKIVKTACKICKNEYNAETNTFMQHLARSHKGINLEKYLEDYPDVYDSTSKDEEKLAEDQTASETSENIPENSIKVEKEDEVREYVEDNSANANESEQMGDDTDKDEESVIKAEGDKEEEPVNETPAVEEAETGQPQEVSNTTNHIPKPIQVEFECQYEECDFLGYERVAFYRHLKGSHGKAPKEYLKDLGLTKLVTKVFQTTCKICNRELSAEDNTFAAHLRSAHKMKLSEYRAKYGEGPIKGEVQVKQEVVEESNCPNQTAEGQTEVLELEKPLDDQKPEEKNDEKMEVDQTSREECRTTEGQKQDESEKEWDRSALKPTIGNECEYGCQMSDCKFITNIRDAFQIHLTKAHNKTSQAYKEELGLQRIMTKKVTIACKLCDKEIVADGRPFGNHLMKAHGIGLTKYRKMQSDEVSGAINDSVTGEDEKVEAQKRELKVKTEEPEEKTEEKVGEPEGEPEEKAKDEEEESSSESEETSDPKDEDWKSPKSAEKTSTRRRRSARIKLKSRTQEQKEKQAKEDEDTEEEVDDEAGPGEKDQIGEEKETEEDQPDEAEKATNQPVPVVREPAVDKKQKQAIGYNLGHSKAWYNRCEYICSMCKSFTNIRPNFSRHIMKTHHMSVEQYEQENNGQLVTKSVYHDCSVCKETILMDGTAMINHISGKHSLGLKEYHTTYNIPTEEAAVVKQEPMEVKETPEMPPPPQSVTPKSKRPRRSRTASSEEVVKRSRRSRTESEMTEDGEVKLDQLPTGNENVATNNIECQVKVQMGEKPQEKSTDGETKLKGRRKSRQPRKLTTTEAEPNVVNNKESSDYDSEFHWANMCSYTCKICNAFTSKDRDCFSSHLDTKHNTKIAFYTQEHGKLLEDEFQHECQLCKERILFDKAIIRNHVTDVHSLKSLDEYYEQHVKDNPDGAVVHETETKAWMNGCKFACKPCDAKGLRDNVFAKKADFAFHLSAVHAGVTYEKFSEEHGDPMAERNIFKCSICPYMTIKDAEPISFHLSEKHKLTPEFYFKEYVAIYIKK